MEQLSSEVPLVKAKIRTGIIYNLKRGGAHKSADEEAEFDDIDTVHSIRSALIKAGVEVVLLEAGKSLPENLKMKALTLHSTLPKVRADAAGKRRYRHC